MDPFSHLFCRNKMNHFANQYLQKQIHLILAFFVTKNEPYCQQITYGPIFVFFCHNKMNHIAKYFIVFCREIQLPNYGLSNQDYLELAS